MYRGNALNGGGKPERFFVVIAGSDRCPVAKDTSTIGLRGMSPVLGKRWRQVKIAAVAAMKGMAYVRFQTVAKGTAHSPSPMEPASSPE